MCGKGQVKPMQCTYCGRDIPDDAVWCPYCGAEQTPPEETTPPDGWQDENIPVGDWDDEADPPPNNTWVDDPPVPGWEDDAPYEPARDADAPRSKVLLIAIFAALGVALIVLLIALNVKPKPKDPVAAVTPVVTATAQPSAAPTPSAALRRTDAERSADADARAEAGRRRLYPAGQRHAPAHAGRCGGPHVGAVLSCAQ